MKKALVLLLGFAVAIGMAGCNDTKDAGADHSAAVLSASGGKEIQNTADDEDEMKTYYYVAPYMGHPYIYDQVLGFKYAAEQFQCKIVPLGPDGFDTQSATEAFEQAVAKEPDGIITVMWDESLVQAAKTAMDQGIPVIVIEAAPEEHGCLTYIGLDTYQYGWDMAEALIDLEGSSGNLIVQGNWGSTNIDEMLVGLKDCLSETGWKIVAEVNDDADTEKAIEGAKAALNNYDDIDAYVGLNSSSGPGIAVAMEELGMKPGEITVVAGAREDLVMEYIESGYIQVSICNKTAMQAYMAIALLDLYYNEGYDLVPISSDNISSGIRVFPEKIYTGTHVITGDNVESFKHENMGAYDTDLYVK